jgi:hypothetical protein
MSILAVESMETIIGNASRIYIKHMEYFLFYLAINYCFLINYKTLNELDVYLRSLGL